MPTVPRLVGTNHLEWVRIWHLIRRLEIVHTSRKLTCRNGPEGILWFLAGVDIAVEGCGTWRQPVSLSLDPRFKALLSCDLG